jgi:hypothetical protein
MEIILQFSFCLHKLQQLMINVVDYLLPEIVMPLLVVALHNGVHLFVVIRVFMDDI